MNAGVLRRLLLATTGIAVAAVALRGSVADALVVRGDEFLYKGSQARALRYYGRALWMDPLDGTAVDRVAFVATMSGNADDLRNAIRMASEYLVLVPQDDRVRMDRAMAYRRVGEKARALSDFAIVGRRDKDARALTFAGFAAADLGELQCARAFWMAALSLAPEFPAPRHALERSEERA
jgi:tetratricopeptide (TPR) repeat protein